MPTVPTPRRRSINVTEARSRQIANAAVYLNISGEEFIQSAILAALISLGQTDAVFAHILARSAGVDWQELAVATHGELLERLQP